MSDHDLDLFVIGAGSGGIRAARVAASHGARVAVCEERYVGGTCVNVGCIPKKLFSYAGHYRDTFDDARGYGWQAEVPAFDWATLVARKDAEIERLHGVYERMLTSAGVELIEGRGRVLGPHEVAVGDQRYTSRYILIATGSWPAIPSLPGYQHLITSNELFALPELPRRVALVGGGYIACEFAAIFRGLGVEVTLIHRGDLLLRGFDIDMRRHVTQSLADSGVNVCCDHHIVDVNREGEHGPLRMRFENGRELEVDAGVCACGRLPLSAGLGVSDAGAVLRPNGAIVVDEHFQTGCPSIYAVGDVIDREQLTPVALAQGMRVALQLFGGREATPLDFELVPTAVFTDPELATVGLTEETACARYGRDGVDIYLSRFVPLRHRMTDRTPKTLMKIIVSRDDDRVRGVHIAGDGAAEMLQGFAVAMQAGATKAQFDATLGIHPTAAEELVTMRTPVPVSPPEGA